jgi:hypothetical protein
MSIFELVEVNPNDAVGGGGCICADTKREDCKPPYAVFYGSEMASNVSPHAVICVECAAAVLKAAVDGDVLAGGEAGSEPEEIVLGAEDVEDLTVVDAEGEEIPEV